MSAPCVVNDRRVTLTNRPAVFFVCKVEIKEIYLVSSWMNNSITFVCFAFIVRKLSNKITLLPKSILPDHQIIFL